MVVEGASGRCRVPYPYQGDLLLYLLNSRGKPYAVNWTVKDQVEAFRERRSTTAKTPVQQRKDREHAQLRGELERRYYASAGVRTVEVSRDLVTPTIQANLDLLFGMHDLDYTLEPALLDDFSGAVAEAVQMGKPVAYVAIEHGARWGARDQFIARIYQDIWDRRLLVDFSEPILIDRPLVTGGCDLLQEFGSFFEESAL
ncbi:hypothetical protein BGP83_00875 [Pseudomonas putida]|nr:hypothetical protein BGP83_00875 [Pseudomonas putida]